MSDKTSNIAYRSYNVLGKSTCIDAGDSNIKGYGSTATNYAKDTGIMDIGFHYKTLEYIRMADNKKCFVAADGTPFIPIAVGCFNALYSYPILENGDEWHIRRYLQKLKDHDINIISLYLEDPWDDLAEWGGAHMMEYPLETYHEETVKWVDRLLDLCEEYDIYLILSPWNNNYYWMNWGYYDEELDPNNPYSYYGLNPYNIWNSRNNSPGPCMWIRELITVPTAIYYQKKRFQYLIDRWGDRPNILAWDIHGELDFNTGSGTLQKPDEDGATFAQMTTWMTVMSEFVKDYELRKWGYTRLRTIASTMYKPPENFYFTCPTLDFMGTHWYSTNNNDAQYPDGGNGGWKTLYSVYQPGDNTVPDGDTAVNIVVALDVNAGIKSILADYPNQLYFAKEHAPLGYDYWGENAEPELTETADNEYEHNFMWAHAASGGLGPGLRWPRKVHNQFSPPPPLENILYTIDDNRFHNLNQWEWNAVSSVMADHRKGMAQILSYIDYANFDYANADSRVQLLDYTNKLTVMACGDNHSMLIWVLDTTWLMDTAGNAPMPIPQYNPRIQFTGFANESHEVIWFNDETGTEITRFHISGSSFTINQDTSISFPKHTALVVRPY